VTLGGGAMGLGGIVAMLGRLRMRRCRHWLLQIVSAPLAKMRAPLETFPSRRGYPGTIVIFRFMTSLHISS
jgi:hypothetical protein